MTTIPPQIATLRNLEQLNISNNKITHLPAEILDMKLPSLSLDMNPWLSPPDGAPRDPLTTSRIVSPTKVHYTIPSLKEFIFRALFTTTQDSDGTTVLDSIGGSAAIPDFYPYHLWAELHRCDPRAIPRRDLGLHPSPSKRARMQRPDGDEFSFLSSRAPQAGRSDESEETFGVGVCPNPSHETKKVFICPAEERYTWERTVAGNRMSFPGIPVLWRGCSPGCLDFLQPPEEPKDQEKADQNKSAEPEGDEGVQVVDLGALDDDDDSEFE